MKFSLIPKAPAGLTALLAACVMLAPQVSEAKEKDKKGRSKKAKPTVVHRSAKQVRGHSGNDSGHRSHSRNDSAHRTEYAHQNHSHGDHDNDRHRREYHSHPSSGFILTLGNGYAGRGYYYGPPNSSYYYERPGVSYYRTREEYRPYGRENSYSGNGSVASSVQAALARQGYYNGDIDGSLGRRSRIAISDYQRDNGLAVTGTVTGALLRSLGLA